MDNAQKAIMIGVGLFITIIIISVVLLITNMGTGIANEATNNVKGITNTMKQQMILAYDGKTVTKSEVVAAWTSYGKVYTTDVKVKVDYKTATDVDIDTDTKALAVTAGSYKGAVSAVATGSTTEYVITFTEQ